MKRLLLLLPLAACGGLPRPYAGNPGAEAVRLAIPKAPVLIIPAPGPGVPTGYATTLATALVNDDVPSVAAKLDPTEWRLLVTAQGTAPRYALVGPDAKTYGTLTGTSFANPSADALALAQKLAAINAQVQQSSPESMENRTPRIFIASVTGAPGDGNSALPLNLSRVLPSPDLELVTDPKLADFTVTGVIKATPQGAGQDLVELDWSVADANGRKIGQVTQLHPLAVTDMVPYWGDVAAAATQEAASGIQDVVNKDVLHKANAPQP